MASSIQAPYENFFGLDGLPMTAGYIYIGVAGLDPVTNPVPVFWDAALTIPASQPLRTNAGYIVRSGSPSRVYVATNYSITVNDVNNVTVYYVPNVGATDYQGPLGSTLIGNGSETVAQSFDALQLADYTALRASVSPRKSVYITGYSASSSPSGIAGMFIRDDADTTSTDNGGTTIVRADGKRYKRAFIGPIYVTWFGARGDNSTNDTAAFVAALSACSSSVKDLRVPCGTYLVDALVYVVTAYANQFSIIGDGPNTTIIKKRSVDSNALMTFGSVSATSFTSDISLVGIQFNGGAPSSSTPASVAAYDLVRSRFSNCHFNGSQVGLFSHGGISNTFEFCRFYDNAFGVRADKFTSLAGGGYPNNIELKSCVITTNSVTGVAIDNSRMIVLNNCDLEGNGAGTVNTGAIYVGPNMGSESGLGTFTSFGVIINECWFEKNYGRSHVRFDSGRNKIEDSYFIEAGGIVTNDIYIAGGGYTLTRVVCDDALSSNVIELPETLSGNYIVDCTIPNISYQASKTSVLGSGRINARSGEVPIVYGISKPLLQSGQAAPTAGGVVTVAFPTAYSVAPDVVCTPYDGTTTNLDSVHLTAVTAFSFTVRCVTYGGTVNTANFSFKWMALGQGIS